jgi:hypothetical protein
MATTTPNFGWPVPTSSDLVKNGATAIEALGDGIDASLLDLKGGTSGQVLKKNSNTDMDFVWGADSAGMTNPMTTTGDTIYSSSGSTPARLGIGSTGQVLTVAGGVPSWATPAAGGGGKVLQVVQATSTTATTIASTTFTDTTLTATITPTSATSKILVLINQQVRFSKSNVDQGIGVKVLRGATDIFSTSGDFLYLGVTGATQVISHTVLPLCYLDSPATTSATTYKTQGKVDDTGNSGSSTWQQGSKMSTITLLEIGA